VDWPAKDIKQIRKAPVDQGRRIDARKGGHAIAYPPQKSKSAVVLPGTPSGSRWMHDLISQLRKSGFIWKGQ
jgi:hypothetical protein